MSLLQAVTVLILLSFAGPVLACEAQAQTELEKVFCKVKAANPQALPYSLKEFRKNPAKTQRLLLNRPAKAAEVALPAAAEIPTPQPARSAPLNPPAPPSARPPVKMQKAVPAASASGCALQGKVIRCPEGNYLLTGNQPNSALAEGAFERRLNLPDYTGPAGDAEQQQRWLADCYREYVTQMTALGLAGSTMSFTRFHHTWQEATARGADFPARMGQMFEFLKKDKASLGVKTHYTDSLPQNLSQCVKLTDFLWVCDNVRHNWVYQRN